MRSVIVSYTSKSIPIRPAEGWGVQVSQDVHTQDGLKINKGDWVYQQTEQPPSPPHNESRLTVEFTGVPSAAFGNEELAKEVVAILEKAGVKAQAVHVG